MAAEVVPDDFHARYSALEKTYLYRVINGSVMSPFWLRYAHQDARPLDLKLMRDCAAMFLGEHDWTAFSAAQSDAENRVRTITGFEISEHSDERSRSRMIELTVSADGFLRYMVRSLVGTLLAVGRNEMDLDRVMGALGNGDRTIVGATAPAKGLTLLRVSY
jgi:tRNA pseudouridine38-40 synthase